MIFSNEFQEMQVNLLLACDARRRAAQVQAGEQAQYYAHTDAQGTTVLLGQKALADAQRQADDAEGGLVARICRGAR